MNRFITFCMNMQEEEVGVSCVFRISGGVPERVWKDLFLRLVKERGYNLSFKPCFKRGELIITKITEE